jgi:glycosyltransferase involved in cell wall biosynthesis
VAERSARSRFKVVLLSKALVNDAYRRKCDELASFPDLDLTVIVPPSWREIGAWETRLERSEAAGYRLVVTPIAFNGHHHVHLYPRLGRVLKRLRPDVFHVDEEPFNLATFHAMWLGRRSGAKLAFWAAATIDRRLPPPFSLFQRATFAWSARAFAGTCAAEAVLRARGYAKSIDVIPQLGVDPDLFRPAEGNLAKPFTIGYLGRLVEAKGVHVLLRAAARLRGDWRVSIVGKGDDRRRLEALTDAEGLAERVDFVPPVVPTRVPDILRKFHVLAVPSLTTPTWKEQFGRVIIEAMACRVPVVGSDSGEIPHVVGDAGIIVPEGDVAALAAAIQRLMDDPDERDRLAGAGRRHVLERYTQRAAAVRYYEAYRQLAADRQ